MDSSEDLESGGVESNAPGADAGFFERFERGGVSVIGFAIKDDFDTVVDHGLSADRARKSRDGKRLDFTWRTETESIALRMDDMLQPSLSIHPFRLCQRLPRTETVVAGGDNSV
jgi:hypothetical protein